MSLAPAGASLSSVPWAGRSPSALVAERNLAIAIVVSILAHVAFFAVPLRQRDASADGAPPAEMPLTVRIVPAEPPAPEPLAAVVPPHPKPRPVPPARPIAPPVAPPPPAVPPPAISPTAPPAPPVVAAAPTPAPQFDMSKLIQANRDRRRRVESELVRRLEAQSASAGPSANAGLARNLESLKQADGTGGVFTITRMGVSSAEFAFNGWNRAGRGRWREYIQVESEPGGNIELAVVRRMIALIREHYNGDFRWESYRLGRTVVLSAAPQDNAGLEEFLMREFFGTPLARRGP